ncbi:MAG: hypothetical protein JNL42_11370 [Anaerolineae bacterium]|nr:hypothetical protein [Anaerolineae bacterium]
MNERICQLHCLPCMTSGGAALPPMPLHQRLRIWARRHFSRVLRRRIKGRIAPLFDLLSVKRAEPRDAAPSGALIAAEAPAISAGDRVRVRSCQDIQATLSISHELKGCAFMKEMMPYCGTTQRVLKRVERFVDERDYRVKKCRGVVLLDGVMCQGTADYGRCDRSCYFFWRDEWLEKLVDEPEA